MAGFADDSARPRHGCTAWIQSIRGSVSNRWSRARNSLQQRRISKDSIGGPLMYRKEPATFTGSGDIVARQQKLIPRPAVIDMKEDTHNLRSMITYLDSGSMVSKLDDEQETLIDIDSVVAMVLSKAQLECAMELNSRQSSLKSVPSLALAEISSSPTSSKITDSTTNDVVDNSLTRLLSSSDPDLDFDPPYSRLEDHYELEKDIVFQNGVIIEVME